MDQENLHSIICREISQRWYSMLTKPILKIWLLSVNFEKFTSIYLWTDQSQHFKPSTVIGSPYVYRGEFIEVNGQQPNFRNDFVCIHYHLCEISSQIIECKIFAPYDFLEMNSITTYLLYGFTHLTCNKICNSG